MKKLRVNNLGKDNKKCIKVSNGEEEENQKTLASKKAFNFFNYSKLIKKRCNILSSSKNSIKTNSFNHSFLFKRLEKVRKSNLKKEEDAKNTGGKMNKTFDEIKMTKQSPKKSKVIRSWTPFNKKNMQSKSKVK